MTVSDYLVRMLATETNNVTAEEKASYLLGVDDIVTLPSKVSFQPDHHHRDPLARAMLEVSSNIVPPLDFPIVSVIR